MDTNKKTSKSNNLPVVMALIIIPILFVFGTMIVIAMVMTSNRPDIKLTLSEPTGITDNSTTFSVDIEGDKDKIQKKGFVYSTSSNPELKSKNNNSSPFYNLFNGYYNYSEFTGTYVEISEDKNNSTATNLIPETKYYVRAYAITGSGINYSNELSFTTKQRVSSANDDIRRSDVNFILDLVINLKRDRSDIFNNRNGLAKNIRTSGYGDCYSSTIKDADSLLYFELVERLGYSLPSDPNAKSSGCSDYGVSVNSDNITVTAPNAEFGPISASSNERNER
jgi:hypothetical protein